MPNGGTRRPRLEPLGGGLALLTSHPRSGTTLLEQVLDSHPGAISADELQVMTELVYMGLGRKALPKRIGARDSRPNLCSMMSGRRA